MPFLKQTLPLLITFFAGTLITLPFFAGPGLPQVKVIEEEVWKWAQIIVSFTAILGVINLLQVNLRKIILRADGWGYNLTLIIGFLSMSLLCLIHGMENRLQINDSGYLLGNVPSEARPVTIREIQKDPKGNEIFLVTDETGKEIRTQSRKLRSPFLFRVYQLRELFFAGVFRAGQSTMFALLAFFAASASFRAFRAKSWSALLLIGAAFIVMIGNTPLGNMVTACFARVGLSFIDVAGIKEWVLSFPSSAAQSAILIGAVLGYISAALKIILGIEHTYLGGEK